MRWDPISGKFRVYEGGGGSTPTSTTTVQQNFSPEEAAQRAKVMEEASRIYNANAGTLSNSPYPGAAPAPVSPYTTQGQQSLLNYATGPGQQFANQAAGYSSFLMGPAQYAESNPYLQSSINAAIRPVTEAFTDPGGVLSQIRGGSINAGQFGGSRQGIAEGIAGRGYLNTIGDISSNMANQNYQNALQAGTQSLALAPQTHNMGLLPSQAYSAVGTQEQLQNQQLENYLANQRMWALNAPWTPLQNYANIVFGGASPGTTTQQIGGGGSQSDSTLQTIGTIASIAAMFI